MLYKSRKIAFSISCLFWCPAQLMSLYPAPDLSAECSPILLTEPRLNVIFDLGGVLVETQTTAFMRKIGTVSLAAFALRHGNPRTVLMQKLDEIKPHAAGDQVVLDDGGARVPALMCDWLSGTAGLEILQLIGQSVDLKSTLGRMASAIFDPAQFVQNQQISRIGTNFVHNCALSGHHTFILSNWDRDSFALMQEAHAPFFELFDGWLISGQCGMLKPDIRMYQELCAQHHLDPHSCVFIDNQAENIAAARAAGMHGILFTDWKSARRELASIQNHIAQSAWYTAQRAYESA